MTFDNSPLLDRPQFELGRVVATRGLVDFVETYNATVAALEAAGRADLKSIDIGRLVSRHVRGDWGNLDGHDRQANRLAIRRGDRVLSSYDIDNVGDVNGKTIFVITEGDRSYTTAMLSEEY